MLAALAVYKRKTIKSAEKSAADDAPTWTAQLILQQNANRLSIRNTP